MKGTTSMTTAITVTSATVKLPDAITFAYATRDEAFRFLHGNHDRLTSDQKKLAQYAYVRASYREGRGLFVDQLAVLAETSVERIAHFAKKLLKTEAVDETWLTNDECSAVLCNMMEM